MNTANDYITPYFYDEKIQELREALEGLIWIQYVHPLARVGVDEEGTFPEVYMNDGTRKGIRVLPTGNAMSFFTMEDINQIDEYDMWTVRLGLVVWADMAKVSTTKTYDYSGELINDVRKVITSHNGYNLTLDINDPFAGFDQLGKMDTQNTMLPRVAFKFEFDVDLYDCTN